MVGDRAALSREAAPLRLPAGSPFSGFGLAATGRDGHAVAGDCRRANLLIIPHPQGRWSPDIIFQNPMFSRQKPSFGPCGPLPPSYMSLNHRNIADV